MIVTPKQLIKQYFPEPIETTRELYDRLHLDESGYSYLDWLSGAEEHCLSRFVEAVDYQPLSDGEKNYWISQPVFMTLIQSSPSPICDQIRVGLMDISKKAATDKTFARRLQDQLDQEYGIEKVETKLSKQLKTRYNESGQDVFEFSVKNDTRLYLDIVSGHNFTPGQKIKNVLFFFQLETEEGIPYHIVDINLSLDGGGVLTYRTIWCCGKERLRYAAILRNSVIRVNLFEDNKKLVDSYEYILGPSDAKTLALELEKIMGMFVDVKLSQIDLDQIGEKILLRYNLNERAYVMAINEVVAVMNESREKKSSGEIKQAFIDAVNRYWETYLLQPDPTKNSADDLEQMIKERIPRVALALTAANMFDYDDLCDYYFKRTYTDKQKQVLQMGSILRLVYTLSAATDFDPQAAPDQRIVDMSAFITNHLDLMKEILTEIDQWPAK